MNEHPHPTNNAVDLLFFTGSDDEVEKAGCGSICARPNPGTGVATICAPESPFPKQLEARRIAANVAKLPELAQNVIA